MSVFLISAFPYFLCALQAKCSVLHIEGWIPIFIYIWRFLSITIKQALCRDLQPNSGPRQGFNVVELAYNIMLVTLDKVAAFQDVIFCEVLMGCGQMQPQMWHWLGSIPQV